MIPFFFGLLLVIYFSILTVLAVYGLHRYYLLYLYYHYYKRVQHPPIPLLEDNALPTVTVQLPIYNEQYVAARIIDAVVNFDYPRSKLHIQVLDDSTDETRQLVSNLVDSYRQQGVSIVALHRSNRQGYKAGALQFGLEQTHDDLIAIFDADFVPPPDFLRTVVPHFSAADIGMVQTRWAYLNRGFSLLTRLQAILLDGHFMLEHTARHFSGKFFNFNGTAGVFRRQTIVESGGWSGDTLSEDLDLSYRAQLAGWRFIYLPGVSCSSELPVDILAFRTQQHRWTKGALQVAKKLLPRIWRSKLPFTVKLESTFHLGAAGSYLLLVVLTILMPISIVIRDNYQQAGYWILDLALFFGSAIPILLFYVISQRELYSDWKMRVRDIPLIFALGIGMCVNNARAVVEVLRDRSTPFVRTAKYRIETKHDFWKTKRYRASASRLLWLECILVGYTAMTAVCLIIVDRWSAIPYVLLFAIGFAYVTSLSILHQRS